MAGRRGQPVDLVVLKGKSHITKAEIEARKEAESALQPKKNNVACPEWLDDIGKAEWERVAKELKALNLLTNVDVTALAIYCDSVSRYREATEKIREEGYTVTRTTRSGDEIEVTSPYVSAATKYAQIISRYLAEFGLSPGARVKLTLPKVKKQKDEFAERFGV